MTNSGHMNSGLHTAFTESSRIQQNWSVILFSSGYKLLMSRRPDSFLHRYSFSVAG